MEEEEALPVLKAAWDRGINTFDTANVYSNGESERIIGSFMHKVRGTQMRSRAVALISIRQFEIPRNQIIIATKCKGCVGKELSMRAIEHPELKQLPEYINQWSLSRTAIITSVDASLKRLGTTYIDLLQIHRFDPETPPEETMKALHDLIGSGKVRYIGACSMRTWHFAMYQNVAEKNGWTKFISMQNEYSLLYREDVRILRLSSDRALHIAPQEREMIPYCRHNGIGLIPWGPVAVGALTRPLDQSTPRWEAKTRSLSEADKEIINRVEEIAKKREMTMAQVALAWVGAKTVSPVVGVSSVGRVDDNVITGFELTDEEMKYLEEP